MNEEEPGSEPQHEPDTPDRDVRESDDPAPECRERLRPAEDSSSTEAREGDSATGSRMDLEFTALTTFGPQATKRFQKDALTGQIVEEGYGNAKHFRLRPASFTDIVDLFEKLRLLQAEAKTFIVRGEPREGVDLSRALRRLGPEPNEPATFAPCPRSWAMLDIDRRPAPDGIDPVTDPERAINFLKANLPPELDDVDLVISWGASQGIKPGKFSAHVFFLLDGPVPDEDLKRWARSQRDRFSIDPAVFHPVQPHYTAAPVFVGLKDPLAGRRLVLIKRGRRTASLKVPPETADSSFDAVAVGVRTSHGYDEHRARIGTEDGFHAPLLSAIGAYVRSHPGAETDVEALAKDLSAAVRKADPGGRTPQEIERYASPKFLGEIITSILRKDAAPRPGGWSGTTPYAIQHGQMVFMKTNSSGATYPQVLANFVARITEDQRVDDGADVRRNFVLEGTLDTNEPLPAIQVPAHQFSGMGWVFPGWGPLPLIAAGQTVKDRVREGIQRFSRDPVPRCRTIYEHTGWRLVSGVWMFLHSGGAISEEGARDDVEVLLGGGLAAVRLPAPPAPVDVVALIRYMLVVLGPDLGPDRITLTLLAAVFRGPLIAAVPVAFSLYLYGRTGGFKSETAALGQRFFGSDFCALSLPANFSSTANSIEKTVFQGKDMLLSIDEFTPKGSSQREAAEMHAKGERIFRGVGNGAARGRLTADGQHRHGYTPRGLVLATGEDLPRGQSLQARLAVVEFGPGDIKPVGLSAAQAAADSFSSVMAAYLQWLAPRIDDLRRVGRDAVTALRAKAAAGTVHRRTPDTVANLYFGAETFAKFAVDVGAMTSAEATEFLDRTWRALGEVADAQAAHLRASDPVERFDGLLEALFSSGRAHVLDSSTGGEPTSDADRWGWTDAFGVMARPKGRSIGYVDTDSGDLYLNPESTFAEIQRLAAEQGEPFPISALALWKQLDDRGRLKREAGSEHRTVRFSVPGGKRRIRVLHLLPAEKIPEKVLGGTGPTGPTGPGGPSVPTSGPVGPVGPADAREGAGIPRPSLDGETSSSPTKHNPPAATDEGLEEDQSEANQEIDCIRRKQCVA